MKHQKKHHMSPVLSEYPCAIVTYNFPISDMLDERLMVNSGVVPLDIMIFPLSIFFCSLK